MQSVFAPNLRLSLVSTYYFSVLVEHFLRIVLSLTMLILVEFRHLKVLTILSILFPVKEDASSHISSINCFHFYFRFGCKT